MVWKWVLTDHVDRAQIHDDGIFLVVARESSNSHDSVDAVCESIYAEIFSVPSADERSLTTVQEMRVVASRIETRRADSRTPFCLHENRFRRTDLLRERCQQR
jgi:hypothetical protein